MGERPVGYFGELSVKFEEFDALKEDGFLSMGTILIWKDSLGFGGRYSGRVLEESFE